MITFVAVAEQLPLLMVYEIVADPPLTNVTSPPDETVATAVLSLLHVPPGVALLNEIVVPAQAPELPVIAATTGVVATVTLVDAVAVQPLASVKMSAYVPALAVAILAMDGLADADVKLFGPVQL